jgi:hypothetical protein
MPIFAQGVKWLILSDGEHSITAVLDQELDRLVDNGKLKDLSIIDLFAFVILDNPDEAVLGRKSLINIGELKIYRKSFPNCIGEPINIFGRARFWFRCRTDAGRH